MEKQQQWIDMRFTLGNLITLCVLIIGGVGGWFRFEARLETTHGLASRNETAIERKANQADLNRLDGAVTNLIVVNNDNRDRLTRFEVEQKYQGELLRAIADSVGVAKIR